ncbi:hypothetical protein GGS23DRAFT_556325 [Durotheca rogersii]|uniref:uncharacterized protein n=1 Tax=Durotheca rogersii TaxID=419775 RepID=UPI00221F6B7A|nr:uncharacterized protein GGS23DRAFT_556325 [Durotheca rogersii]KAI5866273.1 hypothetical protein GGS23DRAFT_556325 [Durotheca rogersii]
MVETRSRAQHGAQTRTLRKRKVRVPSPGSGSEKEEAGERRASLPKYGVSSRLRSRANPRTRNQRPLNDQTTSPRRSARNIKDVSNSLEARMPQTPASSLHITQPARATTPDSGSEDSDPGDAVSTTLLGIVNSTRRSSQRSNKPSHRNTEEEEPLGLEEGHREEPQESEDEHQDSDSEGENTSRESTTEGQGHVDADEARPPPRSGPADEEADIEYASILSEGSFAQDVENFKARYPDGYENSGIFDGALRDDGTTAVLDLRPITKMVGLMTYQAWRGKEKRDAAWAEEPFVDSQDTERPPTRALPIRSLLLVLRKLETVILVAPWFREPLEQNRFFYKHGDLLSYYFSKVEAVIQHIRTRQLADVGPDQSDINNDPEARRKTSEALAHVIIPMLVHILGSIRKLDFPGKRLLRMTISIGRLLSNVVTWIEILYDVTLREMLSSLCGDEGSPEPGNLQRKLRDLADPLTELSGAIKDGLREIDRKKRSQELRDKLLLKKQLEDKERQQEYMRQLLRREARAQQLRDEEMRAAREHNYRAKLSMRRIHIPLSESAISYYQSKIQSAQAATSAPRRQSPRRGTSAWSHEERLLLFRKIQESYPELPHLDELSSEIDREPGDVEAAAEEILGLMLANVHPEKTKADIAVLVGGLMRAYRRAQRR